MADTTGIITNWEEAFGSVYTETLAKMEAQFTAYNLKGEEKAKILAQVLPSIHNIAYQLSERSVKVEAEILNMSADTLVKQNTASLVMEQITTEESKQSGIASENALRTKQMGKVDAEILTEGSRNLNVQEDTLVKVQQALFIKEQADTELKKQGELSARTVLLGSQNTTESYKQSELSASVTLKGKQGYLVDEQKDTEGVKQRDILAGANLKAQQKEKVKYDTKLVSRQEVAFNDKLRIEEAKQIANAVGMAPDYVQTASSDGESAYTTMVNSIKAITPITPTQSAIISDKTAPTV